MSNDAWIDVDPWAPEGAVRPGPPFAVGSLPPLLPDYKRRRPFSISYGLADVCADCGPLTAKQARAFVEDRLSYLHALRKRARFHEPKVCYFDLPGENNAS